LAETILDRVLEVELAGYSICKRNCNIDKNAANFELGCKCSMHVSCLISSIQKGHRKCTEYGCAHKRDNKGLKYDFKASDYEKLWVRIMN